MYFYGGVSGLPTVEKGVHLGLDQEWGEDTDWVIKAEAVVQDSFKPELLWRQPEGAGEPRVSMETGSAHLACQREEGRGRAPPGESPHGALSPPVQQGVIENQPATQSTASARVFGSVKRWLESLPKALYSRVKEEPAASSPFNCPGL